MIMDIVVAIEVVNSVSPFNPRNILEVHVARKLDIL